MSRSRGGETSSGSVVSTKNRELFGVPVFFVLRIDRVRHPESTSKEFLKNNPIIISFGFKEGGALPTARRSQLTRDSRSALGSFQLP